MSLVNLRAGQDSGYFFLFETLEALMYAADNGIDVVNMSFFTDPWLFNCRDNPLDTPAEQAEQRTVIDASNNALDYACEPRRDARSPPRATSTPISASRPTTRSARTSRPARSRSATTSTTTAWSSRPRATT